MSTTRGIRTAALVAAASLAAATLATTTAVGPAHAATSGSLTAAPTTYVGGQAITLTGRLGVSGRRLVRLQQHMGRAIDTWWTFPDSPSFWTASDGSFRVRVPAPDMMGIRYRAVSGSIATPAVLLSSKVQGADLSVAGTPTAGVPFEVTVDTTPDVPGRSYALGTPVFPGRVLSLQKRTSATTWTTLARTTELAGGTGRFAGITEPEPGTVVYRVVQGPVTAGGSRIGSSTSFPRYVGIAGAGAQQQPATPGTARYDAWQPLAAVGAPLASTMKAAFSTYRWGGSLFNFNWERGESLGSGPDKGTGRWSEYSDGTGRVGKLNGMLSLDARRENTAGPGDRGTTMATMAGGARRYGRWEVRLNVKNHESTARDYDVRVELVPALASQYACGARNILVGQVRANSAALTYGVKNGTLNWSQTRRLTAVTGYPALAVEVEPGHITWFYAGVPIGTVRSPLAVSDVPLNLRISLVGRGTEEMNQTVAGSDWQRGYAATTGRQVLTAAALRYGAQPYRCDS